MLISEQNERGRKFKLALRAGLPILVLVGLIAYAMFFRYDVVQFGLGEAMMTAALVFVTTYFIFFLLEEDSQKTLLDHTTNSYNFAAFLDYSRWHKPKSIALVMIDNLQIINENYGTDEVNTLLKSFVYQLDAVLSANNIQNPIIGRQYGAEFVVGCDSDGEALGNALESFVSDHSSIQNIELDYKYSVNASPHGNIEHLILNLHDAIKIRRTGKEPINDTQEIVSEDIDQQISEAIHQKRVVFTFRPLHNIRANRIDAYEISIKLKLPTGKTLLPRAYLPIVNRLGLGREHDFAVLEHVLSLLPLVDSHISFGFNISPFSLRDNDFRRKAFELLGESHIDTSRLFIQLYERKTHHNLESYLKTLESFRDRGIRICIDNFGSSDSSIDYMRHFNFDMVQFDRDFVANLNDPTSSTMLSSLIDMSKTLHITTIAKWVDNSDQKEKLISMGVDYLQGYGIAKPLNEEKLVSQYN